MDNQGGIVGKGIREGLGRPGFRLTLSLESQWAMLPLPHSLSA